MHYTQIRGLLSGPRHVTGPPFRGRLHQGRRNDRLQYQGWSAMGETIEHAREGIHEEHPRRCGTATPVPAG